MPHYFSSLEGQILALHSGSLELLFKCIIIQDLLNAAVEIKQKLDLIVGCNVAMSNKLQELTELVHQILYSTQWILPKEPKKAPYSGKTAFQKDYMITLDLKFNTKKIHYSMRHFSKANLLEDPTTITYSYVYEIKLLRPGITLRSLIH